MSHTVKHTPTGAVCTVRAGAGRRFKRLHHKRERALVRMALCAGVDADFRFTAARTSMTPALCAPRLLEPGRKQGASVGDGKIDNRHAAADLRQ